MKIFIAQIKSIAGDIKGNVTRIKQAYNLSLKNKCDICLLPELVTSGYLAEDLFLDLDFIAAIFAANNDLIKGTKECALILPTLINHPKDSSIIYNGALVAQNGKIIGQTHKFMLPNYGIFDEKRYFTPGTSCIISINGIKIGIPICEDIWHEPICNSLAQQGSELFLVPNASPFELGKFDLRLKQVVARYNENKIPIIFCNQSSATDGIIFDGNSFCYDGNLHVICQQFREDEAIVIYEKRKFILNSPSLTPSSFASDSPFGAENNSSIYQGLVMGLKSYILDNGFTKVILGISGGIDSALVACLCADSIGCHNVSAYMMPSKLTSDTSKKDAKELATLLDINYQEISIIKILESYVSDLHLEQNEKLEDLTYQNLQARIRGSMLMTIANKTSSLLITTGNKSEYATGYATIYGDMNGAFNPIKDLYKTQVISLCNYRNSISWIIPKNIINKPPSAELATNQKDTDSLLEYDILDRILYSYIELNLSRENLYKKFQTEMVDKVIKLVLSSEFKRKQSAPGVKISRRNFEKDRRMPITNLFNRNS